jgi:hypothetical protein
MSASTWLTRDLSHMVVVAKDLCGRSGANGVKLHDPNFFHDMSRAQQFSGLFADEVGLPWAATMHPSDLDHASDNGLDQLASDGLVRVLVGLESPDPKIVRLAVPRHASAACLLLLSVGPMQTQRIITAQLNVHLVLGIFGKSIKPRSTFLNPGPALRFTDF